MPIRPEQSHEGENGNIDDQGAGIEGRIMIWWRKAKAKIRGSNERKNGVGVLRDDLEK